MRIGRLTRVAQVRGIDIYIHWTILALGVVILAISNRGTPATLLGFAAYFSVLILHESGHLIMARRRGYRAYGIAIFPFLGLAYHEGAGARIDRALIAWGGVLAQMTVAIPVTLYVVLFGYTPYQPINAALVILGGYSLFVALFNLLPIPPLDGSKAWDIIPAWFEQRRYNRSTF
jgi:Zn-dependent protease